MEFTRELVEKKERKENYNHLLSRGCQDLVKSSPTPPTQHHPAWFPNNLLLVMQFKSFSSNQEYQDYLYKYSALTVGVKELKNKIK